MSRNRKDPYLPTHNTVADYSLFGLFFWLLLTNSIDPNPPVQYVVADVGLCILHLDSINKQVYTIQAICSVSCRHNTDKCFQAESFKTGSWWPCWSILYLDRVGFPQIGWSIWHVEKRVCWEKWIQVRNSIKQLEKH